MLPTVQLTKGTRWHWIQDWRELQEEGVEGGGEGGGGGVSTFTCTRGIKPNFLFQSPHPHQFRIRIRIYQVLPQENEFLYQHELVLPLLYQAAHSWSLCSKCLFHTHLLQILLGSFFGCYTIIFLLKRKLLMTWSALQGSKVFQFNSFRHHNDYSESLQNQEQKETHAMHATRETRETNKAKYYKGQVFSTSLKGWSELFVSPMWRCYVFRHASVSSIYSTPVHPSEGP